ncbi:hypothetical protein TGCAST_217951 [Toxoplasma gondii CAST]|uniref:Uncharacterized protein n=1 Tax=Toxoplasma gondii CAST TaxID=943122 RepID=A0A425HZS7_TOXGO|nr:hypothetical protein TGCAST_217951 [Toxoplasma gondii CAST]
MSKPLSQSCAETEKEMVSDEGVATMENELPEGHEEIEEISAANDAHTLASRGNPEGTTTGEQQRQKKTREAETEKASDVRKDDDGPFCTSSASGTSLYALAYYCMSKVISMPLTRQTDNIILSLLQISGEKKPETPKQM